MRIGNTDSAAASLSNESIAWSQHKKTQDEDCLCQMAEYINQQPVHKERLASRWPVIHAYIPDKQSHQGS